MIVLGLSSLLPEPGCVRALVWRISMMRILSWNVNGLYNTLKDAGHRHSSVSNYFSQVLRADILCFQEAKIQEEKLEKWMACVLGYESFWAFSIVKKGYSGVVTYVKEDLSPIDARADYLGYLDYDSDEDLCKEGRLMETDHGSFVLINVYVPNGGGRDEGRPRLNFKLQFLKALKHKCDEIVNSGKEVVVLGDFNIAHKDIDVYKNWNIHEIYTPEEISWMDDFFTDYVDLFRYFHPDARDVFSVWNMKTEARIHNEGVRIDYAACSKGFLPHVVDAEIIKMVPKSWSDHAAVVLTLRERPVLPAHQIPAISSRNMKRFQEDQKQKKLTSLFAGKPLKAMPPPLKEPANNDDKVHTLINGIEKTSKHDADLSQRVNTDSLDKARTCKRTKESLDVEGADGSKGTDPEHLSTVFTNKHLILNLNDEKQGLVEDVHFDQKHELGFPDNTVSSLKTELLDANETTINANESNQLTEARQCVNTTSSVSPLDCTGAAFIGKESENFDLKSNSPAEDASNTKGGGLQKTLRKRLSGTPEKSMVSKKHKVEGKLSPRQASQQKSLRSYFRTQDG